MPDRLRKWTPFGSASVARLAAIDEDATEADISTRDEECQHHIRRAR
ncbi:hypothetical protein OB919_16160 [Halobacteria archaeon AArc-curdl1]|uniref:Uncharacterized protein n=1 Tax=Natronosalvus hydrolyticus TaxID=2979988 RepID=A0AAP2ZB29_9EURY|nr:hypothetical protein [Halobacteria archaeon AArc-curdl1]